MSPAMAAPAVKRRRRRPARRSFEQPARFLQQVCRSPCPALAHLRIGHTKYRPPQCCFLGSATKRYGNRDTHGSDIKGWAADGDAPPQLVDALKSFGKSRATRLLTRRGEQVEASCAVFVRLPGAIRLNWAALRKVWRAVMDAGKPGDQFMIDLMSGQIPG
jgi:hypothetical protein